MGLYLSKIMTDRLVRSDIKALIPDAGLRRRMSRIVKMSVATAVECLGDVERIDDLDAIITATGYGCLVDSERFLRNIINDAEDLLNPTPFIQSTFNTVGGQIAMLRHNHCYNMTYVNRTHSFEDALLDAYMKAADKEASNILVGAFDERTDSQHEIMKRMGAWRKGECGEGCVFMLLTAAKEEGSIAEIAGIDFPDHSLTEDECRDRYASSAESVIIYNDHTDTGLYPAAPAMMFAKAAGLVMNDKPEVVVYNELWGYEPAVVVLRCV